MQDFLKKHTTQDIYEAWAASVNYVTPNVSLIDATSDVIYNPYVVPIWHNYANDYLTFVALEDNVFIQYSLSTYNGTLSYSLDNGITWSEEATSSNAIYLNTGDKILFKGNVTSGGFNSGTSNIFTSTIDLNHYSGDSVPPQFNIEGNIMSLLYGDNFINQITLNSNQSFYRCFQGMPIGDASNLILPATTLSVYCYQEMFYGCSTLTSAPELPATILAERCYMNMFNGCTSLTTAPELPATTLTEGCYIDMFDNCMALTTAPELPATTLTESCYKGMFSYCTSLITAPELPATTLAGGCYNMMFFGCTSLNYIKCLATDISATDCTNNWVSGVAASGTFVKNASMSSWTTGTNSIPFGWTVQDAA